jgi:hypothetical protein
MATAGAPYDRGTWHPKIACNFLSHVTPGPGFCYTIFQYSLNPTDNLNSSDLSTRKVKSEHRERKVKLKCRKLVPSLGLR